MGIIKLIISIILPPIGLFINLTGENKTKLDKISTIISIITTILFVSIIILFIMLAGLNNKRENNLLKCRNPYYCDISEDEYVNCYYCKDKECKNLETIRCLNDEEAVFNYTTIDNPEDE